MGHKDLRLGQPEKNQDDFLFGRDGRRTVFRPPASAPKEMMGTGS